MNICFINPPIEFYSPVSGGAIATIIAGIARELILAGHHVSVLTPVNGDPTYDIGEVIPVAAKRREDLGFLYRRWSSMRSKLGRYDWPHYHFFLDSVVLNLRRLKPAPDAVVMFNDLYLPPYVRAAVPGARIAVWLQNECRTRQRSVAETEAATDVFFTCSQYIADWTVRTHQFATDKICVARSGVDAVAFSPREDYLWPSEVPRVLFLGRLDRNKGPDLAVAAVAALKADGIRVALTLAGGVWFYSRFDPASDAFYAQLMESLKAVDARAIGHVPRDDVPALIASHDIVCVLSRSNEPFALVGLEAMAGGCAVLASNRGGLPEMCDGAAVLVDPDDQAAVTAALRKLVTDPQFLAGQKRRSVERAARAGWDATARVIAGALQLESAASLELMDYK